MGHVVPANALIWEEDQEKKVLSFSQSAPAENNNNKKKKKGTTVSFLMIHWGHQRTYDGSETSSITTYLIQTMYRSDCLYMGRATPSTWSSFLFFFVFFKWDREKHSKVTFPMLLMPMWQRFSSRFPEITWRVPCWATRTDDRWSSLEIIPLQYNFIKWKQLLLAKTILLNVQLSKAQKSNLYICWVWFFWTNFTRPTPTQSS